MLNLTLGCWKSICILLISGVLLLASEEGVVSSDDKAVELADQEVVTDEETDREEELASEEDAVKSPDFQPERPFPFDDFEEVNAFVVPIQGAIGRTTLFIVRRALKQAIDEGIDLVIFDIDTPGGGLGVTLEIMEAIDRFPGVTASFVNSEAISAGAYIAIVTDYIFFTPRGIMGAAEAVRGDGQEIPEGMQRKLESYLSAKIEVFTDDFRYRGKVLQAMAFPNVELEIDGRVLSAEGELFTVTARRAHEMFGDPLVPLLGSGIFSTKDELLEAFVGKEKLHLRSFEITWSENVALFMQTITPALIGLGLLLLFVEFKTPGFGVPGIAGIVMLLVVFASNYLAGLAGNEEIIVFVLGVLLVLVEIFLLPGVVIFALVGVLLILGALLWAMADLWPEMDFIDISAAFFEPFLNLSMGIVLGLVGAVILARYLPQTWVWDKLVLSSSVGPVDPVISKGANSSGASGGLPAEGSQGVALTDLYPGGEVEVDGRRFQATSELGQIESGERIEVVGFRNFGLLVRKVK